LPRSSPSPFRYCIAGAARARGDDLDATTARALNAINRRFYSQAAEEFSATRDTAWPGWGRLLEIARDEALPEPLDVLDLGCGNGRFATFLAEQGVAFRYLGVDSSEELIERARARSPRTHRYRAADFVEAPLDRVVPERDFSLVVLFGVLHHVPGRSRRALLLRQLGERLVPGGLLALTAWQFQAFRRFREKFIPWEQYNRGAPEPIDLSQLEEGDHLLPWGSPTGSEVGGPRENPVGGPVRFCHFSDAAALEALLAESGLEHIAAYTADGREGDLNRYYVLRRRA
jgi:SAM-dependent methyltransferase